MATINQRNAAFDAAKAKALVLVKEIVPWPFEERAEDKINDKANTRYILAIVDAIVGASGREAQFKAAKNEALELGRVLANSEFGQSIASQKINDPNNAHYIYAIVDAVNHAVANALG